MLENMADSKLKKAAEEKGNQAVAAALQAQHLSYISDLKDQVEQKLLPKMEEERQKLELAAERVTSSVTGSQGFVFFDIPSPAAEPNFIYGFLKIHGPYPQYDVHVEVHGMSNNLFGVFHDFQHDYGTLLPTLLGRPLVMPRLALVGMETKYGIDISARGGAYWQNVNFQKVNGKWYRATRLLVQGSQKILYESVDKEFPRDRNRKIRW
jgi:hypothetical protein